MIGVGRRHRHRGRAGRAVGHGGLRLDHPAGFRRHPLPGAEAAVGVERPTADHPLERIVADPLMAAGFRHAGDRQGVIAEEEIAVVFPAIADRRLPFGALVDPVTDEERHRREHLGRRRRRVIGKLAVRRDRPRLPLLVADGGVAHLSGDIGLRDGDQPHPLLDRQAVADGPDPRHLHLQLRLGKLREKSLEKRGDLLTAGEHVAVFIDQLPLFGEQLGEGLGIPLVERFDRGSLRLLHRLDKLRRGRRGLDHGHLDHVDLHDRAVGRLGIPLDRLGCSARRRGLPGHGGTTEHRGAHRDRRHDRYRACRPEPAIRRTVHTIPLE